MKNKDFLLFAGVLVGIILVASVLSFATGNVVGNQNIPKEILTASTTENEFCLEFNIPKNLLKNAGNRYTNNLVRERVDFVGTGRTGTDIYGEPYLSSYDSDVDTGIETPESFLKSFPFAENGRNLVSTECGGFQNYLSEGFNDIYVRLEVEILNPTNRILAYGAVGISCHKDTNACSTHPIKWQEFTTIPGQQGNAQGNLKAKEILELIE